MGNERLTDDRLDEVIDAAARRMTDRAPARALASAVRARLERRRPSLIPVWQLAALTAAMLIAALTLVWLRPEPVTRRAATPITAPSARRSATPPSTTVAGNTPPAPRLPDVRPRREARTIAIERRSDDIPALERPAALSIDAAPVARLNVPPLDLQELSVAPIDLGDAKPR